MDQLDRKDVEILKRLKNDSRTPMGVIGDQIGISKATVSRRVARMEDEKVIKNYSMNIDLTEMGIMKSLIAIQVMGSPVNTVIEALKEFEEIGTVYKAFGDHNLVCEAYTHNVDELYNMIQNRMLKIMSIRNVEVDVLIGDVTIHDNADIKLYEKYMEE